MSGSNGRLAATSREPEEWARATEAAREVRAAIAGQVAELIVSGDKMGSRGELTMRLEKLLIAENRLQTAQRARVHARQSGVSEEPARRAVAEGHETIRAAVMDIAVVAAQWVAALDFEPPIE